jgi:rare lipoprotein A
MRQTIFAISFLAVAALLSSFGLSTLEEFGKAGYYADSLQGRKTASGEKYDKNDFTGAHKSLPFGTKIRVTRLDNKKSVVVRVNDRGPFVDGYVTDVSRRAAEEIGLVRDGVTRVKIEVVEAASQARVAAETDGNTKLLIAPEGAKTSAKGVTSASKVAKPATYNNELIPASSKSSNGKSSTELYKVDMKQPSKSGFGVQVSTLYDANNVLPELKKLQAKWPGKSLVLVEKDNANNVVSYKLLIGPYPDKNAAEGQQKLAKKAYKGCFVVDLSEM